MSELHVAECKLAELQQQIEQTQIKASSLAISIRESLSPYLEFEEIKTGQVLLLAKKLDELSQKFIELTKKADNIKKSYNL